MKSAKTFTANLRMTVSGAPDEGAGSISVKAPDYLVFKMKWGKSDYSFSVRQNDIVAIERESKTYREYGGIGGFFIPEPDISRTPAYGFPAAIMAGTLKAMVPDGVPLKADGKGTIEGVAVDYVSGTWQVQVGSITARAAIDGLGRPVEFERKLSGNNGAFTRIRVGGYRVNEPMSPADFATPIPAGFVPETLPADSYPVNVGEKFPLKGWTALSGSANLETLTAKKVLFLAVGSPHCEASKRAAASVRAIAKSVESKGGVAAAISTDPAKGQSPVFATIPNFYDPKGQAFDRLRAPGTPMFFLIAPNGRVTRVWYGFDVAKTGAFSNDVLTWVEKSKKPEEFFKSLGIG